MLFIQYGPNQSASCITPSRYHLTYVNYSIEINLLLTAWKNTVHPEF